ncbi:MAG: hypothetical protein R6V28_16550 [Nitriliruptoraceae bacterium]
MTPPRDRARDRGPGGAGSPLSAVQRPLASGLTIAGIALLVLGVGWALVVLEVLPAGVGAVVAAWWPAILVVAGGWLLRNGRRVTGTALGLLGVLLLIVAVVPDGFVGPTLLILAGLLLLWGATGGRQWLFGGGAVALFDDLRLGSDASPPARSYVAVFGESEGRLESSLAADGIVECLAVFGDVQVHVPADVAVELSETAVFGDVWAPAPPRRPVTSALEVRATAVFGDVRLVRD